MKKIKFDQFSSILCFGLIAFLLYQRLPIWFAQSKFEGQYVKPFSVTNESGETISVPKAGKKQVIIFWATWCGPCTVELARFNAAVKDGEIKADDVLAISLGEDPSIVWPEVKRRDYRFLVATDSEGRSQSSLEVFGTPQIYQVEVDAKIDHVTMGLGLFSVWRARYFLGS